MHFEWLHSNWSLAQAGKPANSPAHVRIEVDEWEFGFGYKRILEGGSEADQNWTLPRLHCMPNIFAVGGTHFEYRTPIDDTHTLSVVWAWEPVPVEQQPYVQTSVPHWYAPITDPATGRWITTHTINQDTVAWVGQGAITDRENEHLGRSDIGVVMLRNRLADDLARVERGEDPSGLIRDPERNACIIWPNNRTERLTNGAHEGRENRRSQAIQQRPPGPRTTTSTSTPASPKTLRRPTKRRWASKKRHARPEHAGARLSDSANH